MISENVPTQKQGVLKRTSTPYPSRGMHLECKAWKPCAKPPDTLGRRRCVANGQVLIDHAQYNRQIKRRARDHRELKVTSADWIFHRIPIERPDRFLSAPTVTGTKVRMDSPLVKQVIEFERWMRTTIYIEMGGKVYWRVTFPTYGDWIGTPETRHSLDLISFKCIGFYYFSKLSGVFAIVALELCSVWELMIFMVLLWFSSFARFQNSWYSCLLLALFLHDAERMWVRTKVDVFGSAQSQSCYFCSTFTRMLSLLVGGWVAISRSVSIMCRMRLSGPGFRQR